MPFEPNPPPHQDRRQLTSGKPMDAINGEMTLRDYSAVVVQRKWVVIAAVLIAVAVAVVSSALQTPIYSADAEILVQSRGQDGLFEDRIVNLNERAIQTEIQVIEGGAVRARVQQDLALEELPAEVEASSVGQTDVVTVAVRSTNAANARTLANAYAEAYISVRLEQSVNELLAASTEVQKAITQLQTQIDALADDDPSRPGLVAQLSNFSTTLDQLRVDQALRTGGATIIKSAETPVSPVEPTPARTAALAFVVGLLIGLGAAFLLDYLVDKIRSEDDLQRATQRPVLAVVPIDPLPNNLPIAMTEPDHASVEAYRAFGPISSSSGLTGRSTSCRSPARSQGRARRPPRSTSPSCWRRPATVWHSSTQTCVAPEFTRCSPCRSRRGSPTCCSAKDRQWS
jgi:succinoglycan biosynthesis transport protein ExoP